MRSDLQKRYFGDEAEERAEATRIREEISARNNRAAQWVTSPFMEEFKQKLETWLLANEPKPASHEEMLFTSGTRKGILMVKDYIEMLERQLKESLNV